MRLILLVKFSKSEKYEAKCFFEKKYAMDGEQSWLLIVERFLGLAANLYTSLIKTSQESLKERFDNLREEAELIVGRRK